MESIVKADIFFFVTTIALVLFSVAFLILLYYIIRIIRNAAYISRLIVSETEQIKSDVSEARAYVREEAVKMGYFIGFIKALMKEPKTALAAKKKRATKPKKDSVE
ncbi:MAG: hypothetical protein COU90_02755 [Candidatus Ryanbacteria bacterium CG10_big_fil_rev_8_21_14_0_10_43_42]|uniref:Uncharacterized protein n=1 Tax=Candidatus Ryanbacteria bacterium CG10_big_fil_rev_8_21_14_0_10_43_42 TaxID=1974864 RepID=A0A2M8KWS0_9BACT|nr:MAG: hypothetical protein COU90_02755 [Candidatus Ryanbacteria bacterium CG10_big_fil_rev_8_21_14_0_10_43_42]